MYSIKINNELSHRHIDGNGYMIVDKSPVLKSGILEYYGSELLPENSESNMVDGVEIDPDKIYKVFIPLDELIKAQDSFKMKPITDNHTWLGDEGEDAKDYQVGMTGEGVYVEDGMLYAPLTFTGKDIVQELETGEKDELSASYYNRFVKSDNPAYDFIAKEIKANHIALVDKGRCGSEVRVLNSSIGVEMKKKVFNKAILELDGKRIDLDRFFEEERDETEEGKDIHSDSISENVDKRELIREIMAVSAKSPDDFEGGDEEKVREIAKLAEQIAYNPSEDSESDNAKVCNEDKRKIIDEIGVILKGKIDEEMWRTVIEKAEKLAYNDSEDSKSDNEDIDDKETEKEEDKDDEAKSMNYNALVAKISNSVMEQKRKEEDGKVKAYNSVRTVLGDFNPFGMSEKDMYVKALNHLSVDLDGKESVAELAAMLKACSAVKSKVDNGFTYGSSDNEEMEINI